ncbi:MAG: glycosyltransferase family 4 protein [Streptococcus salivarius]
MIQSCAGSILILGILEYFGSYNRYSKQIAKYAKENGITLIHNNTTAVLEGIYLKRKLKLPLIWHVHEIIVKPKAISDFINFLMGRYADTIVTVSNAVANHVKQSRFVKNDQVQVIYNGVDNAVYHEMDASAVRDQFGIAQDALVIGMVGRVNAWKGQGDFLEAVTPILKANPKAVAFWQEVLLKVKSGVLMSWKGNIRLTGSWTNQAYRLL